MERLPDVLRNAVNVDFCDVVCALEADGWVETRDVDHVELPVEVRVELETDRIGGLVFERRFVPGSASHLFAATLDPPHRAVHARVQGWRADVRILDRRTLELIEDTALGPNPLLALANMSRLQIAHAFEALCRTPSRRAASALCYHAADHPEDLFAVTAAFKTGADLQEPLLACLREPHEGAVEVAAHVLGEVGDETAYVAIDVLHVWDRGVFAEAMRKIRARTQRPQQRREEALASLAAKLAAWTWPIAPAASVADARWNLWDLEALVHVHEPRESTWWHFWADELPPNARPFAQLSVVEGVARIARSGQSLFEVRIDPDVALETIRVTPPAPLGGVLVRLSRDAGYRAASVVEVGCLVTRDATWEALPHEDRRDVLYFAPEDALFALDALAHARGNVRA